MEAERDEDSFTDISSTDIPGPFPSFCAAAKPQLSPFAAAEISLLPLLPPPLPEDALVAAGLRASENDIVRSTAATVESSEGLMHKRSAPSTNFENRQSKVNQTIQELQLWGMIRGLVLEDGKRHNRDLQGNKFQEYGMGLD